MPGEILQVTIPIKEFVEKSPLLVIDNGLVKVRVNLKSIHDFISALYLKHKTSKPDTSADSVVSAIIRFRNQIVVQNLSEGIHIGGEDLEDIVAAPLAALHDSLRKPFWTLGFHTDDDMVAAIKFIRESTEKIS